MSTLPILNAAIALRLMALTGVAAIAFAQGQSTTSATSTTAAKKAVKNAKPATAITNLGEKAQDPEVFVKNYLAAAGTLKPSATNKFLSAGCQAPAELGTCDLVPVFRQKEETGWKFSGKDTTTTTEIVDSDMATVAAKWVFDGGGTSWSMRWKFLLVRENGTWKITQLK